MGDTKIPEWILDNEVALECWERVFPQVAKDGYLHETRVNTLSRYCLLWAQWRETQTSIEKHGQVLPIKDDDGKVTGYKDRPEVARSLKISKELTSLEFSMGIPRRPNQAPASDDDDLQRWRDQRKSKRARSG
jgi:P27 family predicted phage terminase small subunit